MQMDTSIFKAYDIRGVYPTQLDENAAYRIGVGLSKSGILTGGKLLVVGRDMRESSHALFEAFAAGACDNGHDVIDIGLSTTPMLYFAVNELDAAGGAMITASHNPGEYNGFKLVQRGAIPIGSDSGLKEIEQQALEAPARRKDSPLPIIHQRDVAESYARFFSERFSIELSKPLIIDTGNGITGPVLRRALRDQAIDYRELFFEPNGRFPNHEANPLKEETLSQLKETIAETPHSIGAAFDGDGDRVCFVDEDGHVVRGDLLCALLARRLLEEDGPADILYDLRSSRIVPEAIHAFGGEPIKTRVGHAFVKQIMRERQALFGGELSYHFYFRDFFHCESGILAMLHVCRLLAETKQNLSELVAPLRKYSHSGEINFRVSNAASVLLMLENGFADGCVSHLDGLSVEYEEWWFNVRPSNTEPLLRLNLEANTPHLMQEKLDLITQMIERKQEGDR
jgi:phosphomannomutase